MADQNTVASNHKAEIMRILHWIFSFRVPLFLQHRRDCKIDSTETNCCNIFDLRCCVPICYCVGLRYRSKGGYKRPLITSNYKLKYKEKTNWRKKQQLTRNQIDWLHVPPHQSNIIHTHTLICETNKWKAIEIIKQSQHTKTHHHDMHTRKHVQFYENRLDWNNASVVYISSQTRPCMGYTCILYRRNGLLISCWMIRWLVIVCVSVCVKHPINVNRNVLHVSQL